MTKTDAQNRINSLFEALPYPEEHELWHAIHAGVRESVESMMTVPELLDLLAAGMNVAAEPSNPELVYLSVLGHIRSLDGATHAELQTRTGYSSEIVTKALRVLSRQKKIESSGTRRAKKYHEVVQAEEPE